jgi:hypothetical protein
MCVVSPLQLPKEYFFVLSCQFPVTEMQKDFLAGYSLLLFLYKLKGGWEMVCRKTKGIGFMLIQINECSIICMSIV